MRTQNEQNLINQFCLYHPTTLEDLKALCNDKSVCLGDIDTSSITDMSHLFEKSKRRNFSGIENWDVSNVELMNYTFSEAKHFNADISSWNTKSLRRMDYIFYRCIRFNSDLSKWDVSKVQSMKYAFSHAVAFNKPLNDWKVLNVVNMAGMFYQAYAFNQPLN